MDCNVSDSQEYQQSEEYQRVSRKRPTSLYEISSAVKDKFEPRNCETTLRLNNLVQNLNSSPSHVSTNSSIQLTKRNVLRDETNTHHLKHKKHPKDEEKENRLIEVSIKRSLKALKDQIIFKYTFHKRPYLSL